MNGNHVALLEGYDIEVESKCGLCGRKLEDPISVKRGIGPECAGKPTGTKILHASTFGQDELTPENQALVAEAQEAADAKIAEIQADAEAQVAAVKQGLADYIEDLRSECVEPTAQQKSLC